MTAWHALTDQVALLIHPDVCNNIDMNEFQQDPYAGMYPSHSGHGGNNSYDDRGHKHEDDRSSDGHRYENHYGGASNLYSAGRRWEEDLPRKESPPHDYYGKWLTHFICLLELSCNLR